jgi:hypothetical protein
VSTVYSFRRNAIVVLTEKVASSAVRKLRGWVRTISGRGGIMLRETAAVKTLRWAANTAM